MVKALAVGTLLAALALLSATCADAALDDQPQVIRIIRLRHIDAGLVAQLFGGSAIGGQSFGMSLGYGGGRGYGSGYGGGGYGQQGRQLGQGYGNSSYGRQSGNRGRRGQFGR